MASRQEQWESRTRTLPNGEVERSLERPEPGVVEWYFPHGSAIRESSAVGTAYILRPKGKNAASSSGQGTLERDRYGAADGLDDQGRLR